MYAQIFTHNKTLLRSSGCFEGCTVLFGRSFKHCCIEMCPLKDKAPELGHSFYDFEFDSSRSPERACIHTFYLPVITELFQLFS